MITLLDWATIFVSPLVCIAVLAVIWVYGLRNGTDGHSRGGLVSTLLLGWWVLAFVMSYLEVFASNPYSIIPSLTIAAGILLPIVVGVALLQGWPLVGEAVDKVPVYFLIGLQFYRAFGIVFLAYYSVGMLPGEFALPAGLGDVVVGISGPVVGYLFYAGHGWARKAGMIWNVFGVLDLVVAVTMGFLSSPSKFQAVAFDHPNTLISVYPLVMVPVFAVPLSIILHFAAMKGILGTKGSSPKLDSKSPS